ncbi:MAG: hypothetical protein LBR81_06180 [Prevotellaceae bacterium]|jgi:hypothetical protein|nr:hypothetical protein [Prevotellaceae bacterium]
MISNNELIEKYFDKSLTAEEKILFKQKYETEPEFKEAFEQQMQIVFALKASGFLNTEPIPQAKKTWLYVSMSVAAVAIVLLIIGISVLIRQINERDLEIVKLQKIKSVTTIVDNGRGQKAVKGQHIIVQDQDSLQKINKTDTHISNAQTTDIPVLLALNKSSDIKRAKKGAGGDFGFEASKNRMDPNHTIIKWTSIDQQGKIFLYRLTEQGEQKTHNDFPKSDENLKSGSITLTGLERNSCYVFMIRLDETGEDYKFFFITQQ